MGDLGEEAGEKFLGEMACDSTTQISLWAFTYFCRIVEKMVHMCGICAPYHTHTNLRSRLT